MNIEIHAKSGDITVDEISSKEALREKELSDARAIRRMMNTEGWKIFKTYEEVGLQSILDAGMAGIRSETTEKLSARKWAILKGYVEHSKLAERIVARADAYLEDKPEEENNNDGSDSEF